MVLSIQTTVTVSFGATYGFELSLSSSRPTNLLAQFAPLLGCRRSAAARCQGTWTCTWKRSLPPGNSLHSDGHGFRRRSLAHHGERSSQEHWSRAPLRKALHRLGFRYRLCPRDLPGRPDIVLPKYRAVVFIHGCFWHSHGCCQRRNGSGGKAPV